jgi:mutator protein MutT
MGNKILAGGIILDKDQKVLLLHRNTKVRQQWEMPGGTGEIGELPTQTTRRELKEELGVDVEIVKNLGMQEITLGQKVYDYYWYLVDILEGMPEVIETDTFDDLKFFSVEELQSMMNELSPNAQNFVKAIVDKKISFES